MQLAILLKKYKLGENGAHQYVNHLSCDIYLAQRIELNKY
jgi:hypothetical protein